MEFSSGQYCIDPMAIRSTHTRDSYRHPYESVYWNRSRNSSARSIPSSRSYSARVTPGLDTAALKVSSLGVSGAPLARLACRPY